MTVQPPEQPIPREPDVRIPPCTHPVKDSQTGLCLVCDAPIPDDRRTK